ncbi:GNAT family N-acetyltransferase [Clostridium manihotivorum]|nr:GNAT family N-acetyltransferase [Clostridium manihotivorum]
MFNKKYWEQNIMYEAGEKVIQYSFGVIGMHRIEALIHPENIASNRLSIKLGFNEEFSL